MIIKFEKKGKKRKEFGVLSVQGSRFSLVVKPEDGMTFLLERESVIHTIIVLL